jgi:hypothetical protein
LEWANNPEVSVHFEQILAWTFLDFFLDQIITVNRHDDSPRARAAAPGFGVMTEKTGTVR